MVIHRSILEAVKPQTWRVESPTHSRYLHSLTEKSPPPFPVGQPLVPGPQPRVPPGYTGRAGRGRGVSRRPVGAGWRPVGGGLCRPPHSDVRDTSHYGTRCLFLTGPLGKAWERPGGWLGVPCIGRSVWLPLKGARRNALMKAAYSASTSSSPFHTPFSHETPQLTPLKLLAPLILGEHPT